MATGDKIVVLLRGANILTQYEEVAQSDGRPVYGPVQVIDANVDLDAGDIQIGSVELKDATTDTRVKIGAGAALVEGDNALAVRDPKVVSRLSEIVTSLAALGTQTDGLEALLAAATPAGNNNIGDVDVASIAAGETHVGEVGGNKGVVSVTFTRPANTTAYAAGDVVSNDATTTTVQESANLARLNQGTGYAIGARLSTNLKSITPRIRVHLFNASTPTVSADNAAWKELYADAPKRLGYFDLPAMTTGTDTANSDMSRAMEMNLRHPFKCAASTRSLFWVLETLDAFTPANGQSFTLTLYTEND